MFTRRKPAASSSVELLFEQQRVGREGDVVDAVDGVDAGNEAMEVATHERLAAGQPDRAHAARAAARTISMISS